jgi:hypothetical protein
MKDLASMLLSGCYIEYKSYDHYKAVIDFEKTFNGKDHHFNCWDIPDEIKEKHVVWRLGKLREIHFLPNGEMWRFKIGAKYAKTFYVEDAGVNFKVTTKKIK